MGTYFDQACAVVDRPTVPLVTGSFWRKEPPVFVNGLLVKGGMTPKQREWWELPNFVKAMVGGYGSGKCVRADTEIYDPVSGYRRRVDQLGELSVASMVDGMRINPRPALAVPSGKKRCVKIQLQNGSKLSLSTDHPVYTSAGWVRAEELQKGCLVGVPKKLPSAGGIDEPDHIISVVGYLMADGSLAQNGSTFHKADTEILDDFEKQVTLSGGSYTRCPFKGGCHDVHVRGLRPLLRRLDLQHRSKEKRLPAAWYGMTPAQAIVFLRAFLGCDAHFTPQELQLALASEGLISDVAHLLLLLGIPSSRRSFMSSFAGKQYPAYQLDLAGKDYRRLIHLLEDVPSRTRRLTAARVYSADRVREGTNRDIVPIGLKDMKGVCERFKVSKSKVYNFMGGGPHSFYGVKKFRDFLETFGVVDEQFEAWAYVDVGWSRAVSVEDDGEHEVYDLSVDDPHHNFVANQIIVHNTFIGAKRIISLALQNAPAPVAYVAPTFPLARNTGIATIRALLHGKKRQFGRKFWYRYNKSTHEFFLKFRGREGHIICQSGDDPESLRGPNLGAVWLDEPFLMVEEVFHQMIARIRHPEAPQKELLLGGCVTRDTLVLPRSGMRPIGQLDPGTQAKEYYPIQEDLYGSYREFHTATQFFNNGLAETRKVTVTCGFEIEATPDHPILVMGLNGSPEWRPVGQLREGDFVAIGRGMEVWPGIDPLVGFEKRLGELRSNPHCSKKHLETEPDGTIKMTEDLAYFLGLWLAEGHRDLSRGSNVVGITCTGHVDWLCEKGVLGLKFTKYHPIAAQVSSVELVELMRYVGMPLVKAPQKYVPEWVFRGKREWALAFLAGMVDGDGCVSKKEGDYIFFCSSSKKMMKQAQLLLLNLGVVSSIHRTFTPAEGFIKVDSEGWEVIASSSNASRLAQILPLRLERKRERLAALTYDRRDGDKIPHQAVLILSAWEKRFKRRWRHGESNLLPSDLIWGMKMNTETGGASYTSVSDFLNRWAANELGEVEELAVLRQNLTDNYYWAKVKSVEEGMAETVDFVVPDTHSFWSNGFISHNTPENLGWGYDLILGEMKDRHDVGWVQASSRDNPATGADYIRRLEASFTDKAGEAYIEGAFVNLGTGLVYYAFGGIGSPNIQSLGIPYDVELGCGMDFNVNPMSAVVFWRSGNHVHVIDEIEMPNADTEYLCSCLREWYVDPGPKKVTRQSLHYIYPDASGAARKTSAPGGKSDFYYIRQAGFEVRAKSQNPLIRDRENAVNGKFKPIEGRPSLTIEPTCKKLIKYLQTHSHENKNTEDGRRRSHLLDAFGYPISYLYPVSKDVLGVYKLQGV